MIMVKGRAQVRVRVRSRHVFHTLTVRIILVIRSNMVVLSFAEMSVLYYLWWFSQIRTRCRARIRMLLTLALQPQLHIKGRGGIGYASQGY